MEKDMSLSPFATILRYMINTKIAGVPLQAYYVINDECNLRCKSCNFWKGIYRKEERSILNRGEVKELIDKISDLKIPYLVITGGEPFLKKDLLEILEYGMSKIKHIRIQTNGTLITPEIAEKLVKMGLDEIWISLDGLKDTHDSFRAMEGSFEKTIDALKNINYFKLKYKSPFPNVVIHTIVFKENMDEIIELLEIGARHRIGEAFLSYVTDIRLKALKQTENVLGRCDISSRQFFSNRGLAAKEHRFSSRLLKKIGEIKRKNKMIIYLDPLLRNGHEIRPRKKCLLLWSSIMISPRGEVLVCPMIDRLVMGDLKQNGLMDIWNSKEFKRIRSAVALKKIAICEDCCCQRRTIFDHMCDPANFKRIFIPRKLRASIYRSRIGV